VKVFLFVDTNFCGF